MNEKLKDVIALLAVTFLGTLGIVLFFIEAMKA